MKNLINEYLDIFNRLHGIEKFLFLFQNLLTLSFAVVLLIGLYLIVKEYLNVKIK